MRAGPAPRRGAGFGCERPATSSHDGRKRSRVKPRAASRNRSVHASEIVRLDAPAVLAFRHEHAPGALDLTAHVDFQALSRAVESMGAKGFGPIEQSQFLRRLGIEQRAASLKTKAARADDIDQALARLIGRERTAMGELFKVAAFVHPSIGTPPGFEASKS